MADVAKIAMRRSREVMDGSALEVSSDFPAPTPHARPKWGAQACAPPHPGGDGARISPIMVAGSTEQTASGAEQSGILAIRDGNGREINLAPIHFLLEKIVATWQPEQVWLFGSRDRAG